MMEDLLNFRTFKETLGTNGFMDIKVSENSIFCKAIICEHTIGLKGVLPETFPYEFPTIYIDEQSYANISPLPRILIYVPLISQRSYQTLNHRLNYFLPLL